VVNPVSDGPPGTPQRRPADATASTYCETDGPSRASDDSLDEVLTPRDLARWLKVPERTLSDWRYTGSGPPFHRVGRHVRYVTDEVRAWLTCQ